MSISIYKSRNTKKNVKAWRYKIDFFQDGAELRLVSPQRGGQMGILLLYKSISWESAPYRLPASQVYFP